MNHRLTKRLGRQLSAIAASASLVGAMLVGIAAPASAAETITTNPAVYDPAQDLKITIDGFPNMGSSQGYIFWLQFQGMTGGSGNTGSSSGALPQTNCSAAGVTFSLVRGAGLDATPTGQSAVGTTNACEWVSPTIFKFSYTGSVADLDASSVVELTFPRSTIGFTAPSSGQYGVNFTAGSTISTFQLSYVCWGNCPVDSSSPPLVTLNIDPNGGTCRTSQVSGILGTWTTAPDGSNCNRYGRFLFGGYNTKPDGSGLAIAPGGNLNLTTDNTLYAIYYAPRAPGAPTDVVAVGGRNSVSVSWKPPADLGAPPGASYVAQARPSGARCSVSRDTQPNADGRLGCTINVPASESAVDVFVTADNFFETSAPSNASNKVRSFDLILETVERPKAGVFARLFRGEGSTVSFTGRAPGAAGSKFTPQLKIGNGDWTSEPSGDLKVGENGNLEWSKVLNKKLDKQAVAVRFAIAGQVSNEYTAEIGKTVGLPSAPRDVKLTAGLGEYTVSWNPPAKDGGSAVTSYVVTSDLRRFNCTVKAPETSCKISLGTSSATGPVELSVRAVSARGEGKAAKATGNVVYRWIQPLSVTTYPVGDRETEVNILFYSDGLKEKQATVELRIGKEGKWKKYGNPEPVNRPNRMYWSGTLGANAQNQPIFIRVSTSYGDTRVRQIR